MLLHLSALCYSRRRRKLGFYDAVMLRASGSDTEDGWHRDARALLQRDTCHWLFLLETAALLWVTHPQISFVESVLKYDDIWVKALCLLATARTVVSVWALRCVHLHSAGISNMKWKTVEGNTLRCVWLMGCLCSLVIKFQCLSLLKMSDVSKVH